jgi:hypothetical protein
VELSVVLVPSSTGTAQPVSQIAVISSAEPIFENNPVMVMSS